MVNDWSGSLSVDLIRLQLLLQFKLITMTDLLFALNV